MTRRPLVAGNWKMNPAHREEALALATGARDAARGHLDRLDVGVFPPAVFLAEVAGELTGSGLLVGAQDCAWEPAGAYTGATSPAMLAGWCGWTLVGHSERRQYFGLTDDEVARTTEEALAEGLSVLVCVGEGEDAYDAGRTRQVVAGQVDAAVSRVDGGHRGELALAYEPVWAIGSGRTPRPEEVGQVLDLIRERCAAALGEGVREGLRVLYGGSVKPDNLASFAVLEGCDGVLVGGASLEAGEFGQLIAIMGGLRT